MMAIKSNENDPIWVQVIKEFGFPTLLVIILLFGIYKGASWYGENIMKPHNVELMSAYKANRELLEHSTKMIVESQTSIFGKLDVIAGKLDLVVDKLNKINNKNEESHP